MTQTSDLDDFLAEELADPEFRTAFEEIAPLVDFGCALAVAREQRRLSLKALAEQIGISRAELNRLENGEQAPTLAIQLELARALNARLEFSANGHIDFVLFSQPVAHRAPAHLSANVARTEKTA